MTNGDGWYISMCIYRPNWPKVVARGNLLDFKLYDKTEGCFVYNLADVEK